MEYININKLSPFRKSVFEIYEGSRLDDLVQSIKDVGVLSPIITRTIGLMGEQEILSGHNRVTAAKLAGLTEIPYINVVADDEEAMLIVIETNRQRAISELPMSKRIKVVAQWFNCLKNQGKISDEKTDEKPPSNVLDSGVCDIYSHSENNNESNVNLSRATAYRYVKISELPDKMLKRIDSGNLSVVAAEQIAYLTSIELQLLETLFSDGKISRIKTTQAEQLRLASEQKKIKSTSDVLNIIHGAKAVNKDKAVSVVVKPKMIKRFFPNGSKKEIIEKIEKNLTLTEVTLPELFEIKGISFDSVEERDEYIISAIEKYKATD